jgi:hypothetical protein
MSQGLAHKDCGDTHGKEGPNTSMYSSHERDLLEKKCQGQVMQSPSTISTYETNSPAKGRSDGKHVKSLDSMLKHCHELVVISELEESASLAMKELGDRLDSVAVVELDGE